MLYGVLTLVETETEIHTIDGSQRGALPSPSAIFFIFIHVLGNVGPNISLAPPHLWLAPLLWEILDPLCTPRATLKRFGFTVMYINIHTTQRPRQRSIPLGIVPNSIGLCLSLGLISVSVNTPLVWR